MENEPRPSSRRWLRLVLEVIVIVVVVGAVLYAVGLILFAIWHALLIVLRLFHLAPGG